MTDSRVLDRIIESAAEADFWWGEISCEELRTVQSTSPSQNRMYVTEGVAERWVDLRAINFVTMGVWDPREVFQGLRNEAPNNEEELKEQAGLDDMGIVNATSPQVREDDYDVCRTRGYVRKLCKLGAILAGDERQDNYTYRVFRVLAESERKTRLGTNPLGQGVKEFYGRTGPVRLVFGEADMGSDDEPEVETTSAGEASW